jgi:ATP-dependent DNA helicase RecG
VGLREKTRNPVKVTSDDDSVEAVLRTVVGIAAEEEAPDDPEREAAKKKLASILRYVKGVGPKKAEALFDAGFETLEDLVLHYPGRYIDARQLVPLDKIRNFLMQPVSVRGKVVSSQLIHGRKRAHTKILLQDASGGVLQLVYFDFPEGRAKSFQPGDDFLVVGYPGVYKGVVQIVQPPFVEHLTEDMRFSEGQILPLYNIPQAVRKAGIKDRQFREIVHLALGKALEAHLFQEILPERLMEREHLMGRAEAIRELHLPDSPERLELARHRIKYEEIFFLQLRLAVERMKVRRSTKGTITFDVARMVKALRGEVLSDPGVAEQVLAALPYSLTKDQVASLIDILTDMSKSNGRTYPMNRLLQGDVGSGKTIVAILAMLVAIENGYQCALMVPTEVLAEQHYHTLTNLLKDSYIQTAILVGGQPKRMRDGIIAAVASGETHIVVGTHALIEKGVTFDRLGLVITDEQHRFGVAQRKALIEKNFQVSENAEPAPDLFRHGATIQPKRIVTPDVLIMTATPIPRTLALTLYGDIDVSTIRELPKNRKPIRTMLFYEHDHEKIYEAARQRILRKGEQVFIVYPLREKSEKVDSEAAERAHEVLSKEAFRDFRVGLIHGKMTPGDKQEAMRKFRLKEFDVLIATTVIEVGIDVPNATVMIIEHAERFGLAQLHQLRGRVGRGSAESACVLVASEKLVYQETGNETSDQLEQSSIALERLQTLVRTSDGFEVARADMMLRGTGEMMGLKQSGKMILKMANLTTDVAIVQQRLKDAETLLDADPQLRTPPNQATRDEFLRLYRDAESFLHVG